GIPETMLPADLDAFEAYIDAMLSPGGTVHPTATSRDLAAAILHPPLAPVVERGAVARRLGPASPSVARALSLAPPSAMTPFLQPAVALLPDGLRDELGLPWGFAERALAAWLTTMWRLWRPAFPPSVRWFPQALAAEARVASLGATLRP
ncbi:MAG TPA: oxygenase MpaB family protein, partial [Candidatus Limnocylindrales bacterium]